jgi:hypothetical protein
MSTGLSRAEPFVRLRNWPPIWLTPDTESSRSWRFRYSAFALRTRNHPAAFFIFKRPTFEVAHSLRNRYGECCLPATQFGLINS